MSDLCGKLYSFDFNESYSNVSFKQVETIDFYRKKHPYKLFGHPGKSQVSISFEMPDAKYLSRVILCLNHCRTTANGIVNMTLNGKEFMTNYQAPRDNFGSERFDLDLEHLNPYSNVLMIQLDSTSPGVYWLSNATIYMEGLV